MPYIRNMEQILPLSNLLNGVLHVGFKISFKKWAKKDEDDTFLRKKADGKQNCYDNGICRWKKGQFFQ